jgi:acid phosphatase type 7
VVVTDLAPATCYRYRIAGHLESGGRFCTGHESGDSAPIRFLAIGDTNPSLGHTAGVMANAPLDEIEFTVHVGDIQYYSSLIESWASWFPQMTPLMSAAAFMPCVGNHEREEEVAAEFDDYYTRFWGGAGEGDDIRYHFATGGVHFFSLSTEDGLYPGQPQVAWLETELDAAAATPGYRFSILYMHRPAYSVSDHGPNYMVRMGIAPSVMEHAIPLVIAGHAHGYERFEVGQTTYLVTGGGGGALGDVNERVMEFPEDAALRESAGDFFHSVAITIDATELRGETIDEDGMIRDTFTRPLP